MKGPRTRRDVKQKKKEEVEGQQGGGAEVRTMRGCSPPARPPAYNHGHPNPMQWAMNERCRERPLVFRMFHPSLRIGHEAAK